MQVSEKKKREEFGNLTQPASAGNFGVRSSLARPSGGCDLESEKASADLEGAGDGCVLECSGASHSLPQWRMAA